MLENDHPVTREHESTAPIAQRERCYRHDFRVIYRITLLLCLIVIPVIRVLTFARRHRGRRPSILAQARSEAGIVASCALMGY